MIEFLYITCSYRKWYKYPHKAIELEDPVNIYITSIKFFYVIDFIL